VTGARAVRGRLAPSPSGRLHLGHARSFVLAWAWARASDGQIVLRLEDLDASRCPPEAGSWIIEDLEWLGLDWDGPVVWQSARLPRLRQALTELEQRGLTYPCVCTRGEIARAQQAPHAGEEEMRYPGTCRGRFTSREQARTLSGREPALRFAAPADPIVVHDAVAGEFSQSVERSVGDFVIGTRDGGIAYQLAVVVDDAEQGVTQVLRGDDLLASTPRQIALQQAFGFPRPSYAHVPLVVDSSGQRLAKRTRALELAELRRSGVEARTILGWVAESAGFSVGPRPAPSDIVAAFDLGRLPKGPSVAPSVLARRTPG
jgi:glutamyl-tRNA synthetase